MPRILGVAEIPGLSILDLISYDINSSKLSRDFLLE